MQGYGGVKMDQAKRLKELERKNPRLRKAVADLTLGKQILIKAARRTSKPYYQSDQLCGHSRNGL